MLVVSKGALSASASYHAQGGIAAAGSSGRQSRAARRRHDRGRARALPAERGRCLWSRRRRLASRICARWACDFEPELGLEGGHSRPRVFHSQRRRDRTRDRAGAGASRARADGDPGARGRARARALDARRVAASARSRAERRDRCARRRCLRRAVRERSGRARPIHGGALGEGVAMAYRAGAAVADLEFVQFHPTALLASGMLLSEALRGAGRAAARRRTASASPTSWRRAMWWRERSPRAAAALLDLRPIDRGRFPALIDRIRDAGFDPELEPVPVAPAAHYTLGRRGHRPRRPQRAARPVRGRRVRLHRSPRRQPAGLELAARVRRLRPPGGAGGARRGPPLAGPARAAARSRAQTATGSTPSCASRCGRRPGSCATPPGSSGCSRRRRWCRGW